MSNKTDKITKLRPRHEVSELSEVFDAMQRRVNGALKSTIDAHGPITLQNRGSAAKRIAKQLIASNEKL